MNALLCVNCLKNPVETGVVLMFRMFYLCENCYQIGNNKDIDGKILFLENIEKKLKSPSMLAPCLN